LRSRDAAVPNATGSSKAYERAQRKTIALPG
jgi:hypothetical protein